MLDHHSYEVEIFNPSPESTTIQKKFGLVYYNTRLFWKVRRTNHFFFNEISFWASIAVAIGCYLQNNRVGPIPQNSNLFLPLRSFLNNIALQPVIYWYKGTDSGQRTLILKKMEDVECDATTTKVLWTPLKQLQSFYYTLHTFVFRQLWAPLSCCHPSPDHEFYYSILV